MGEKIARITKDKELMLKGEIVEYPSELEGGRNLLRNGNFELGLENWTVTQGATLTLVEGKGYKAGKGAKCKSVSLTNLLPRQPVSLILNEGESIVGQAKIKGITGEFIGNMRFANLLTIPMIENLTRNLEDGWKQYFFKYTAKNYTEIDNIIVGLYNVPVDFEFIVDDIKLEKGNTPTPWSPAPEDLWPDYPNVKTKFLSDGTMLVPEIVECEDNAFNLTDSALHTIELIEGVNFGGDA